MPRQRNRRFPVKFMNMGVIANPNVEHGFNDKIYIKRIGDEMNMSQRNILQSANSFKL